MGGEEKTFKVNFTSDGIERLRNEVTEKLKEFMGDYTDDTLVEYVIVLLRNGRTKDEARNELNVFLGDEDSNAFVTWLWDHLSAKLNLYVQSDDASRLNEEEKQKSVLRDSRISQSLKNPIHDPQEDRSDVIFENADKNTENPASAYEAKTSYLRSVIAKTRFEEENQHKPVRTRKSLSPRPSSRRKRNRVEERHHPERNTGLMAVAAINPTSRLLQSAVREAVGTAGLNDKAIEPSAKRLRSVVATSNVDDSRRRLQSVAKFSSIAGVALKAAAEAAEDVLRARPSGNVFDRLGRGVGVVERTTDHTENGADGDHEFHDNLALQTQLYQLKDIKDTRRYAGDMINQEAEFTTDMDQDYNDDTDDMSYRNNSLFQTSTSFQDDDDSTITRYGRAANSSGLKSKYQNQPAVHPSYDENVSVPDNATLRKPHQYMTNKKFTGPNSSRGIQGGDVSDDRSDGQLLKKDTNGVVGIGNGKSALFFKTELHKTPSGSAADVVPQEDSDARTIFINNVHFAATKDNLSRHFIKFGQVLRVTILTDATTGLPKGSAYVEFMQKEAAVQATTLDGTSFMSRIIRVCMKGSSKPETPSPSTTAWSGAVPRRSAYPVPRFSRFPFPRGNPSSFRGRAAVRPGPRSLQWKRDAQPANDTAGVAPGNSASPRSLTYVRPELKSKGKST